VQSKLFAVSSSHTKSPPLALIHVLNCLVILTMDMLWQVIPGRLRSYF